MYYAWTRLTKERTSVLIRRGSCFDATFFKHRWKRDNDSIAAGTDSAMRVRWLGIDLQLRKLSTSGKVMTKMGYNI